MLGATAALSYQKVKKHIKKNITAHISEVFDEKAKKFEKEMVEKYDMALWEQDEFDKVEFDELDEEPIKEEPKEENVFVMAPEKCMDLTPTVK